MSTVKANTFLDSAGGNTATINSIPLRPGILDPQNLIINGAFEFWQRGSSFTSNGYGADRWVNGFIGGTVTMSLQSFAVGDTLGSNSPGYYLRHSVSGQTLVSQYSVVVQYIEGVRSYAGQTITVLGWARRSSGTGNTAISFDQYFGTGGSPSAVVEGAGQQVALTTSWAPFAVTITIPSITGKTLGTNGNDNLALVFWTSAGSNFNTRSASLGLQTIGVDFWGIHIKLGTHTVDAVSLYKQPETGPEFERCMRYYEVVGSAVNAGAGNTVHTVPFKVRKRAVPSVSRTGDFSSTAEAGTLNTASNAGPGNVGDNRTYSLIMFKNSAAFVGGWFTIDAEL